MLGKLIKYDFKSCWREFWPIWSALIVLSFINGLTYLYCRNTGDYSFIANALPKLVLFGVGVAATVIAFMYIIKEFSEGLLGERGYLMFTLPAKESELILSKTIVALILVIISGVTLILSILAFFLASDSGLLIDTFKDIVKAIPNIRDFGIIIELLAVSFVLVLFTALTCIYHIYMSVSIGHLFGKNRRLFSILAFIGLCVLSIFLMVYVTVPIMKSMVSLGWDLSWRIEIRDTIRIMGFLILEELLYGGLFFFAVRYILKNKLNLE